MASSEGTGRSAARCRQRPSAARDRRFRSPNIGCGLAQARPRERSPARPRCRAGGRRAGGSGACAAFARPAFAALIAGDHVDADVAGRRTRSCTTEPCSDLEPARARGLADDDMGDVLLAGEAQDVVVDAPRAGGKGDGLSAQPLRQPHRLGKPVALRLAELEASPRLDAEGGPGRVQPVCKPLGVAHERWRIWGPRSRTPGCARPRPRDRKWPGPASARAAARRRARRCAAGPARATP